MNLVRVADPLSFGAQTAFVIDLRHGVSWTFAKGGKVDSQIGTEDLAFVGGEQGKEIVLTLTVGTRLVRVDLALVGGFSSVGAEEAFLRRVGASAVKGTTSKDGVAAGSGLEQGIQGSFTELTDFAGRVVVVAVDGDDVQAVVGRAVRTNGTVLFGSLGATS